MSEQVGQINISFDIFSNSPQTLIVADLSDWAHAEDMASYITIQLPGSTKEINYAFNKHHLNPFNSHNLGISCLTNTCAKEEYVDLPDGIYTVTVKSGFEGIETQKFYLKTDRFEIEKAKAVIKHGFEYDENDQEFQDAILDVEWLLTVAKSHAKLGDFTKAQRFFTEATRLLNRYIDCKDCI